MPMHRLFTVSKRVHSQLELRATRIKRKHNIFRRLTTETTHTNATPHLPPKKKISRFVRRVLFYSSAFTLALYTIGTLSALRNERFHDFFVEFLPYGERIIDFADQHGWEGHPVEPQAVVAAGKAAVEKLERASLSTSDTKVILEKAKTKDKRSSHSIQEGAEKLKATSDKLTGKVTLNPKNQDTDVPNGIAGTSVIFPKEVAELASKAELALNNSDELPHDTETTSAQEQISGRNTSLPSDKPTYTHELPLGFEPPPGFMLPSEHKATPDVPLHPAIASPAAPSPLPLVAPAVSAFSSSEPVLSHLANTIDSLAAFLKDNPSATVNSNAKEVLDTAQIELVQLGEQIQRLKDEEKVRLEDKLDEQAREYSIRLLQLEMDAQDKLDLQDQEWQKHADEERQQVIHDYRAKLEAELKVQSEIINERLKEEVIAQGIELQRRWIREIKVRVEEERGGRLAKLDELAADLKRLSRVTLDNSAYLDENLRLHALWSSIRALNNVIEESPIRKPFREELRVLRHTAIAGATSQNPVLAVALDSLENSDIPDVGVEPFADLMAWLTTSIVPRVSSVALVPEQNAGILSHLASSMLSTFRFPRRGYVEGDDVLSVLARAEYYMNEKDLDGAARELNQLKGPAKMLLSDWLDAARRRLEVLQAIEIVQSQATLASLLLV